MARKKHGPIIYYIRTEKTYAEMFYSGTTDLNHQKLMREKRK